MFQSAILFQPSLAVKNKKLFLLTTPSAPPRPRRGTTSLWVFVEEECPYRLAEFPAAFVLLQEYSLCKLVERTVERAHAVIKRVGGNATYILAPYLCSIVRESYNLALLKANADFHEFAVKAWFSKSLLNDLLKLRVPLDKLRGMPRVEKLKTIYQTSLDVHYADTSDSKRADLLWAITAPSSAAPPVLGTADKLASEYLKYTFHEGHFFSMPTDQFEASLQVGADVLGDHPDPVSATLSSVDDGATHFDMDTAGSHTFFRVVRSTSAVGRFHTVVPHVARNPDVIEVSRCTFLAASPARRSVLVFGDQDQQQQLNLRCVLSDIGRYVRHAFQWSLLDTSATLKPRPTVDADGGGDTYTLPLSTGPPCGFVRGLSRASQTSPSPPCRDIVAVSDEFGGQALMRFAKMIKEHGGIPENGVLQRNLRMDDETLERCLAIGALSCDVDVAGESRVFVAKQNVLWSTVLLLGKPVPLVQLELSSDAMKGSKLALMVRLRVEGWRPSPECEPWEIGGALCLLGGLSRPKSYFAALLDRQNICTKVPSIHHGRLDGYYKCLLNCPAAKLADHPGLADITSNKDLLAICGAESEDDDHGADAVPDTELVFPSLDDEPGHPPFLSQVFLVVVTIPLRRCFVCVLKSASFVV